LLQFRIAIDGSRSSLTLERYQRKNFESSTCVRFKDKYNSGYKDRHCKQMPGRVKERDLFTLYLSSFGSTQLCFFIYVAYRGICW